MTRQLHPATAALALLALACLAGCSNRQPIYAESDEVAPIRVPEGLSRPNTDTSFEIPGYSLPELAAQGDETAPPQVLSSAEAEQARSRIRFGPTGLYLEVDDQAASVWRRLGFALNRGEMNIEQVLDSERRFRVQFRHDPIEISDRGFFSRLFLFWKSPEYLDYSGTYLFEVQRETTDTTRVAILNEEGGVLPMQRAEFVLSRLQQRLG